MSKRRARNLTGNLLDCPRGIDPQSWVGDSLLTKAKAPSLPPACHCPPPQPNRVGGCRPGLRWVDHDHLTAYCCTCDKALLRGRHKRRDQVHMLGLAELRPDNLDLEDLVDAGWLTGDRPEPIALDPTMAWPVVDAGTAPAQPLPTDAEIESLLQAAASADEVLKALAATDPLEGLA